MFSSFASSIAMVDRGIYPKRRQPHSMGPSGCIKSAAILRVPSNRDDLAFFQS